MGGGASDLAKRGHLCAKIPVWQQLRIQIDVLRAFTPASFTPERARNGKGDAKTVYANEAQYGTLFIRSEIHTQRKQSEQLSDYSITSEQNSINGGMVLFQTQKTYSNKPLCVVFLLLSLAILSKNL